MKNTKGQAGFSTIEGAICTLVILALVVTMAILVLNAGTPENEITESIIETVKDLPEVVNALSDNTDGWSLVEDNPIRQTVDNAFDNGDAEVDITLPNTPDVPQHLLELARQIEDNGGSAQDIIEALSEQDVNVVLMQAILSELGFNTP